MDDYKEIKEILKPRRDIMASNKLRRKVKSAIDNQRRNRIAKQWLFGGVGLGTVAAVLLLVLIPSGMSAKKVLAQAIDAFISAGSIEMLVEIRTRPIENFRYIDLDEDFVTHHINISKSDSLLRWRVDKGGRVATGNGSDIYTWIPSLSLGWHINDSGADNILGYMSTLLNPGEVLETELDNCIHNSNAEYDLNKNGDEIILTIHAGPQGNFENPYLLNTSIVESESVRRYIIDYTSKRLKSVSIGVVSGEREVIVLKVSDINYGVQFENISMLPDSIKFVEFDNQPDGLKCLSAEEAASTLLNAFAEWNEKIIDKMMVREMQDAIYRDHYLGARLYSIGRSFTSGSGNSIFVPFALKLRDGTLHRHNIALQKTDSGGWIVVGGL